MPPGGACCIWHKVLQEGNHRGHAGTCGRLSLQAGRSCVCHNRKLLKGDAVLRQSPVQMLLQSCVTLQTCQALPDQHETAAEAKDRPAGNPDMLARSYQHTWLACQRIGACFVSALLWLQGTGSKFPRQPVLPSRCEAYNTHNAHPNLASMATRQGIERAPSTGEYLL